MYMEVTGKWEPRKEDVKDPLPRKYTVTTTISE